MAHGFNRMGRAAGRGFYDYEDSEPPELWSGLKVFERRRVVIPPGDIRDRLLFIQSLASQRCLTLGIVADPADADRSAILGAGFPEAVGGTMSLIKQLGAENFASRANELADRYGARFSPATGAVASRHDHHH